MVRRREIGYLVSGSWVSNIVRETTYLHIVMVGPSRIRKSDFFCAQKKELRTSGTKSTYKDNVVRSY